MQSIASLKLVLLLSIVSGTDYPPLPHAQASPEYQIKAAFLFNFTHYVNWPAAGNQDDVPFVMGIVGADPFGKYIDDLVRNEAVAGRSIEVQRFASADDVTACHMLFINLSDKNEIRKLMERVKPFHTLTISDLAVVERQGGIIRFVTEHNKTKLRINIRAAEKAGLEISSKLLTLAEIVELEDR